MMRRANDVLCVFQIHFARLRTEVGAFLLVALVFPSVMYMFANAVGGEGAATLDPQRRIRFLTGSIVCSLSLTAVSWLGYLLLENRFTGRLKLFATLPLAPSSYVLGILLFALAQATLGTASLFVIAAALGVPTALNGMIGLGFLVAVLLLTVLCVCGISVVIAARARSFSEGSLLTDALGAGLVFLAPVYCTPESLPAALQIVSRALPTTYAANGVGAVLAGGNARAVDLVTLAAMTGVALAAAFHVMRWQED